MILDIVTSCKAIKESINCLRGKTTKRELNQEIEDTTPVMDPPPAPEPTPAPTNDVKPIEQPADKTGRASWGQSAVERCNRYRGVEVYKLRPAN